MKIKKIPFKKIGIVLLIALILSQFIRIDNTNPPIESSTEFSTITNAPEEIITILKTSCYDCHSNEVNYPWYTNVAPISWWIKHHIKEGSQHLNFSIWGTYSEKRKDKKLKECVEMIEEGEMPMTSYTIMHEEAKLSSEQKEKLMSWFKSLRGDENEEHED